MSHVALFNTEKGKPFITCLESVRLAAKNLGMDVFERNTYKWYGRHVGDWKLPPGWRAAEPGRNATLVLKPNAETRKKLGIHDDCYELAVIEDKVNPGAYTIMYDFYAGGHGLDKVIGSPVIKSGTQDVQQLAPKFVQHYRMCADALSAVEAGDSIEFEEQSDGSWVSYTVPSETRLREEGY